MWFSILLDDEPMLFQKLNFSLCMILCMSTYNSIMLIWLCIQFSMYIDGESLMNYPCEIMYEFLNMFGLVLWFSVMLTF